MSMRVRKLAAPYRRSPDQLSEEEVRSSYGQEIETEDTMGQAARQLL
jgi:hypothetical protein